MSSRVLIAGQGVAGTLLGWELEKAGVDFAIADPGHAAAASMVAAGIINPVTGRRLVRSWRVDALWPIAREAYRELEALLGIRCWHEVRVRRYFADSREREIFAAKSVEGELAPWVSAADAEGFWIEPAARVDLPLLLRAARERWRAQGRLREEAVTILTEAKRYGTVCDCRGMGAIRDEIWSDVPWEVSKGEILEVAMNGLADDVVLNRRHWIASTGPGVARVGATHEPGVADATPTAAAAEALLASARILAAGPIEMRAHLAGVRVNLRDKRPILGRHPRHEGVIGINALGAKGALSAPWIAAQAARLVQTGSAVDVDLDAARFNR